MGAEVWMIIIFCLGYLLIVLEHPFKIDKTAPALLMGIITWAIYIMNAQDHHLVTEQFMLHKTSCSAADNPSCEILSTSGLSR